MLPLVPHPDRFSIFFLFITAAKKQNKKNNHTHATHLHTHKSSNALITTSQRQSQTVVTVQTKPQLTAVTD